MEPFFSSSITHSFSIIICIYSITLHSRVYFSFFLIVDDVIGVVGSLLSFISMTRDDTKCLVVMLDATLVLELNFTSVNYTTNWSIYLRQLFLFFISFTFGKWRPNRIILFTWNNYSLLMLPQSVSSTCIANCIIIIIFSVVANRRFATYIYFFLLYFIRTPEKYPHIHLIYECRGRLVAFFICSHTFFCQTTRKRLSYNWPMTFVQFWFSNI